MSPTRAVDHSTSCYLDFQIAWQPNGRWMSYMELRKHEWYRRCMTSSALVWEVTYCFFHCTSLVEAITTFPRLKNRKIRPHVLMRRDRVILKSMHDGKYLWKLWCDSFNWIKFPVSNVAIFLIIPKVVKFKFSESLRNWRHWASGDDNVLSNYLEEKLCSNSKWFQFQLSVNATLGQKSRMENVY